MRNKCHICNASNSVAVRYYEKSIVSMCPKCVQEGSAFANMSLFRWMYEQMKDGVYDDKIVSMEDVIWTRSFILWITDNKRK